MPRELLDDQTRFEQYKFEQTKTGCLLWIGPLTDFGYGYFINGHRKIYAHRFAYSLKHGQIGGEVKLHHTCNNKSCVNTEHMQRYERSKGYKRKSLLP